MTNLVQKFEKEQINKLVSKKRIPAFRPGDTLKVTLKIVEGEKSRLQAYEGLCIARKNNSVNSKFTVRKMSHGEGVERVFPLFSPNIDKIEVIRKGAVKRAKLYYLRDRTGKSARIADRDRGDEVDQYQLTEMVEAPATEVAPAPVEEKKAEVKKSESPASEAENTEDESKK
jgi:large subunit ribosomal protein L19